MTLPLPQMLQPGVINETISQLKVTNDRLQNFFNAGASRPVTGRHFAYDVFDETREVAGGRMPGTGPARIQPQPVGNVAGVFPRVHESMPLLYEQISNQRQLGTLTIDLAGQSYILEQERILAQRYTNHAEFQFAAMIRGSYFFTRNGDDLDVSFTAGTHEIDFQIPAGNKAKLDMLGGGNLLGDWSNVATDIPANIEAVDAAYEQLTGRNLRHLWLNSITMSQLFNNTKMKERAGTANVMFNRYDKVAASNDFIVVFKGLPNYVFHITNGVLNLQGTVNKLISDNRCAFMPDPDPTWIQLYEGSEVVVEYPGATPTHRHGRYFWAEPTTKPAGYELIGVMNQIPALKVPLCIAFGTTN